MKNIQINCLQGLKRQIKMVCKHHMYYICILYMCTRLERLKIVKFLLYPDDGKLKRLV